MKSKAYQSWHNAKARCNNPKARKYEFYGGKGIKMLLSYGQVLDLWERDNANKMKHPSLDRINANGDYILENCRFIEFSENRSRRKEKVCRICGIKRTTEKFPYCWQHWYYQKKYRFSKDFKLYQEGYFPDQIRQMCKICKLKRWDKSPDRLCKIHWREKNTERARKFRWKDIDKFNASVRARTARRSLERKRKRLHNVRKWYPK